ncbi:MAG: DUF2914 domain-containing protein [Pseudomonadota bacterium]
MKTTITIISCIAGSFFLLFQTVYAQPSDNQSSGALKLQLGLMCEDMQDHSPENPCIVFSVASGKVFCFTFFNPVPEKTYIFHTWFHEDKVVTKRKLLVEPPLWKTYSTIQLREDDKGPWRVEITDQHDKAFKTLRFSVSD